MNMLLLLFLNVPAILAEITVPPLYFLAREFGVKTAASPYLATLCKPRGEITTLVEYIEFGVMANTTIEGLVYYGQWGTLALAGEYDIMDPDVGAWYAKTVFALARNLGIVPRYRPPSLTGGNSQGVTQWIYSQGVINEQDVYTFPKTPQVSRAHILHSPSFTAMAPGEMIQSSFNQPLMYSCRNLGDTCGMLPHWMEYCGVTSADSTTLPTTTPCPACTTPVLIDCPICPTLPAVEPCTTVPCPFCEVCSTGSCSTEYMAGEQSERVKTQECNATKLRVESELTACRGEVAEKDLQITMTNQRYNSIRDNNTWALNALRQEEMRLSMWQRLYLNVTAGLNETIAEISTELEAAKNRSMQLTQGAWIVQTEFANCMRDLNITIRERNELDTLYKTCHSTYVKDGSLVQSVGACGSGNSKVGETCFKTWIVAVTMLCVIIVAFFSGFIANNMLARFLYKKGGNVKSGEDKH